MHNLFNRLFYLVLFIGFFLPTNSSYFLPLPGVQLSLNELAFVFLPIINLFCYSQNNVKVNSTRLKTNIILLIIIVVFTEVVVKNLVYGQSFGDAFKTIRIGLPLFSSLVLIVQGIRADIRVVWKTLLLAISASTIISLLSLVIDLPIYHDVESGTDILSATRGRVKNANFTFGLIGMYLLIQDNDHWYSRGKLVKITAILSIFAIILSFNRTLLALLFLEAIYLLRVRFNLKKFLKITSYGILVLLIFFGAYFYNDTMRRQMDKRIFSILEGKQSIAENTIEDNREVIYTGCTRKIGFRILCYWIAFTKLPYLHGPHASHLKMRGSMSVTDTSVITILLRYGIHTFTIDFADFKAAIFVFQ